MTHLRSLIPAWQRYGMAVLFVIAVAVIRVTVLQALSSQFMFAMFYPVVMFCAWYAGFGPGLFAAVLAACVAPNIGAPPRTLHWFTHREWVGIVLFMFNCTFILIIIESLHRARHRLILHQNDLESLVMQRTSELAAVNDRLVAEMKEREATTTKMLEAAKELQDVKAAVNDRAVVAEIDGKGIVLRVNDNFCALSKYSRNELEGYDYRTLYWEPYQGDEPEKMWETLHSGKVWRGDLKIRAKNGEALWVDATVFSDPKDSGQSARYIVVWVDITDRKLAEKALRQSEARYRAIGESMDYGVWICDSEGRNTYVSDSLLNLVGYTQEQFSNFGWHGVVHPDEADAAVAAWKECVRTGGQWEWEFKFRGVDGQWHVVLGRGAPVRDDEGDLCGWAGINVDITKLKQTEQALRESEARYRVIGESLNYGVWTCDSTGRNTYVSDSFLKLVGLTREQCAEFGWAEMLHPDDREATVKAWVECVRTGSLWDCEHRFKGVDGLWHYTLARGMPVKDAEGKVLGWAGINLDISRQKQAEQALRESEGRYRAIGESLNYGVWLCEPDGRNTYTSDSFLKLVGMTQEQCSNYGWGDVLHPDDAEATLMAWKECVRTGGIWDREHRFKGIDGKWHHVLARGAPVKNGDGQVLGWAGINLEIDRLKETEQALADSEAHLRNVLDSIFAFVGVMQTDGTMTEINRAVLDISRIPSSEVVGRKFWDCMWWEYYAAVREQIQKAVESAASGEVVRFDVEGLVAGGQYVWVDLTIAPMRDAEGRVTFIIPSAVDVTERKRGEQLIRKLNAELEDRVALRTQQLYKANEELRQQFETIRRFEEEIVHVSKREQVRIGQDLHDDLGQQLAGIWCFMRVVEKNLARQHSPEAENAARISEMLEKSLATTRSLAHGLLPVPQEPRGLMSALTTLASRVSEMFNINCKLECPVPVLIEDNTKATHLYRITQESISNAVKHGDARNVTIELASDEHNVTLVVLNDGTPVPGDDLVADGMGLRIMRYRAGIIGGTLGIENIPGGNVALTCTMPLSAPDESSPVNHALNALS